MKVLYAKKNGKLKFGERLIDYDKIAYLYTSKLVKVPCFIDCDIKDLKYKSIPAEYVVNKTNIEFLNLKAYTEDEERKYCNDVFRRLGKDATLMSIGNEFNKINVPITNNPDTMILRVSITLNTLSIIQYFVAMKRTKEERDLLLAFETRNVEKLVSCSSKLGLKLQDIVLRKVKHERTIL